MLNAPPTFEVVGDGELSDAGIEALARLLLSLVDQDARSEEKEEPESA